MSESEHAQYVKDLNAAKAGTAAAEAQSASLRAENTALREKIANAVMGQQSEKGVSSDGSDNSPG